MRTPKQLADVLLGSIVALVTAPTGIGAGFGGWIAGRRSLNPARGALAGGVAGLVGGLPWAGLVYLASAGAIDPVGYHEGLVHVGINTADPALLTLWQELALSGLVAGVFVAAAVAGGLVASTAAVALDEVRVNGPATK